MKDLIFGRYRKFSGIYVIWVFINVVLWSLSDGTYPDNFWPFEGYLSMSYDLSEFLVYAISPLVIITSYHIFKK